MNNYVEKYIEAVNKYCLALNNGDADKLLEEANSIFRKLNLDTNKDKAKEVFNRIAELESPHAKMWAATHLIKMDIDRQNGVALLKKVKSSGGVEAIMADAMLKSLGKNK